MPGENDETGKLLLALQNRINDLETKLSLYEKEREKKTWVESSALDSRIAEIKAVISELEKKQDAIAKGKESTPPPKTWLEEIFGF